MARRRGGDIRGERAGQPPPPHVPPRQRPVRRFTADGQTVVYSAAWGSRPAEIFLARVGSPESRPLGIPGANLLSVSSTGELAILLKKTNLFGTVGTGTLARVPLTGGTPRQVLDEASAADWSPDGSQLAVLRRLEGNDVLEWPIGKSLAHGEGLTSLRMSPDGGMVAMIDGSQPPSIVTIDRAGKRGSLGRGFTYIDTIAWHPSGKEIWFDGVNAGERGRSFVGVFAVDLAGRTRTITETTDLEVLHDIARDGSALVEREISTREILFSSPESAVERDLSWLDQSSVACLSADGKTLLFHEQGEGGGKNGSVYLRTTDGAPPVRLGDGAANDLSPDGRWVLTSTFTKDDVQPVLLPTAAGEPRPVPLDGYRVLAAAFVPPDGKRIAFVASEPGKGQRGYVLDLAGGKPRPLTPEGMTDGVALSPDGKLIAWNDAKNQPTLYSFDGGEPRLIDGLEPGDVPIQWSADGGSLYVTRRGEMPLRIQRYSFSTKTKTLWKELLPDDRSGLVRIENVFVTPDGKHYAYSFSRVTNSDLYVVTGWK